MEKNKEDYQLYVLCRLLIKLKNKNESYRQELKVLSAKLDLALDPDHKIKTQFNEPKDFNGQIEAARKKVVALEHEIKNIRNRSPKAAMGRVELESMLGVLKDRLKLINNSNKQLQRKVNDNQPLQDSGVQTAEKELAELRSAKEKLKNLQKKYEHEQKIHDQNLNEIQSLEFQFESMQDIKVNIVKINTLSDHFFSNDKEILDKEISDLEYKKRVIEMNFKQEFDKINADLKQCQSNVESFKKELKAKCHAIKIQEHEINYLKRKIRSMSAKRFTVSPELDFLTAEIDRLDGHESKLHNVKSDTYIPKPIRNKPPRSDSFSPAAERLVQLKRDIEKVQKQVDLIRINRKYL